MADTSTFPTIRHVCENPEAALPGIFVAGGTIKAGMVVCFADTGESLTVIAGLPSVGMPLGVAAHDAVTGDKLTVYGDGAICYLCEGPGLGIDAGHFVVCDDATIGGCIKEYDPTIGAHAATADTAALAVVGQAIEDISANGTGRVIIRISPKCTASS